MSDFQISFSPFRTFSLDRFACSRSEGRLNDSATEDEIDIVALKFQWKTISCQEFIAQMMVKAHKIISTQTGSRSSLS